MGEGSPAAMTATERPLSARGRRLLARFRRERGFLREWHHELARYDPDFLAHYLRLSSHMYRRGALPPKVKELILMALDAACTHQHTAGARVHMRNALRHGATAAEVVETLELCTLIGVHSCSLGLPVLAELLAEAGAGGGRPRRGARRRNGSARGPR